MLQRSFAEHQLEVDPSHRPYPDQSNLACRFLEQTPTDHCSRARAHMGYQKLKTRINSNNRISCLTLAENIWNCFMGATNILCSAAQPTKCMLLTNVAPFKRGINRQWYKIYCQEELLQKRSNLLDTNFLIFCTWLVWLTYEKRDQCQLGQLFICCYLLALLTDTWLVQTFIFYLKQQYATFFWKLVNCWVSFHLSISHL